MTRLVQFPHRLQTRLFAILIRCIPATGALFVAAVCSNLSALAQTQQDSHSDLAQLQGKVVDAAGKPVVGAKIQGVYLRDPFQADIQAVSDSNGAFSVQRAVVPVKIYARTPDRKLAGVIRLDSAQNEATVVIGPVAEVRGHLVDDQGATAGNWQINYGVSIFVDETQTTGGFRTCFGAKVTTDSQGIYILKGLVPGEKYDVRVDVDTPDGQGFLSLFTAAPTKAETIDQGETTIPRPYRKPAFDEPTTQYFSHHENLDERIDRAKKFAAGQYLRVLLIVGDPKSEMAHNLVAARSGEDDLLNVLNDFKQLAVSIDDATAMAILKQTYNLDAAKLKPLSLVVLDVDGRVLGMKNLSTENSPNDSHQPLAYIIEDFIMPFILPRPDTEKLLAAAPEGAHREGKLVLLEQTGTYCGWCQILSRFIDRHPEVFDANFIIAHIDDSRFENGEKVMKPYLNKAHGGIPWCAILDADGKKLADWDAPDGNIGYPSQPKEIDYFLKILAQSVPKITTDQIAALRSDLEADGKKYAQSK